MSYCHLVTTHTVRHFYFSLITTLTMSPGERPYRCPVDNCSKAFRQLSSLQQHLKGHNVPMPKSYPLIRGPVIPLPPIASDSCSPLSGSPSSGNGESSSGNKVFHNYNYTLLPSEASEPVTYLQIGGRLRWPSWSMGQFSMSFAPSITSVMIWCQGVLFSYCYEAVRWKCIKCGIIIYPCKVTNM